MRVGGLFSCSTTITDCHLLTPERLLASLRLRSYTPFPLAKHVILSCSTLGTRPPVSSLLSKLSTTLYPPLRTPSDPSVQQIGSLNSSRLSLGLQNRVQRYVEVDSNKESVQTKAWGLSTLLQARVYQAFACERVLR